MKKISKTLFGFILGIFVSFVMNVAADVAISSGSVSYSNTTVSAALDELFSAVDINDKIGTTNISNIGNGTITGAIKENNNNISQLNNNLIAFDMSFPDAVANSNIQIDKAYIQKVGNMGLVRISFTTTAAIAKYTQLFKNLKSQIQSIGITSDYYFFDTSRTYQFEFDHTGYMQTFAAIPSGTYIDIALVI